MNVRDRTYVARGSVYSGHVFFAVVPNLLIGLVSHFFASSRCSDVYFLAPRKNFFPSIFLIHLVPNLFIGLVSHFFGSSRCSDVCFLAPKKIFPSIFLRMAQPAFPEFDIDPSVGRRYLLLPVHDAKQKILLHTDGRVYSRRIEVDPADGRRRSGLYCAADRYVVGVNGDALIGTVCSHTPTHPCGHVPTPVMHQFHRALRAAKLLVCDLLDRGVIPPVIRKATVVDILTPVFRAYAPNYPDLDVGAIFDVRRRGFRYIFDQLVQPNQSRSPWAVVRGSDKPVLRVEIGRERMRGPAFGEAYEAVTERFPVEPEVIAEREELEVQDAGPALDGVFAALRAQSRAVGMPIASITINYVGPHGGRRPKRHNLPPE